MKAARKASMLPVVVGLLVVSGLALAGWDPLESTCRHASLSIL